MEIPAICQPALSYSGDGEKWVAVRSEWWRYVEAPKIGTVTKKRIYYHFFIKISMICQIHEFWFC